MNSLDIKKTEKKYVNVINSSNKNDTTKFDLCCYIIDIVVSYGLDSKAIEEHLKDALDNVTKGKHYDCLNYNTLKRLKSLCCKKQLIELIKKEKPNSVKSFLNSFNINTQNLLETACYSIKGSNVGGIFSDSKIKEKDTKKLHTQKRLDAQKRKAQGKTNQQKASDKEIKLNTKNIEKNIQNSLLFLKNVIENPELKNHAFVVKTLIECLLNKDNEKFNIHYDNYIKNGTKAK